MDSRRPGDFHAHGRGLSARGAVSRALTALRADVLGGRGPGADHAEIEHHTRCRRTLAGRSMIEHLQETARRTASFRSTD